jgi:hypothetical protein
MKLIMDKIMGVERQLRRSLKSGVMYPNVEKNEKRVCLQEKRGGQWKII